jgi:hypothetical protein
MSGINLDLNSADPVDVVIRQGAYEYRFQARVEDLILDTFRDRAEDFLHTILVPPYYKFTLHGTVVTGIGSTLIQREIDLSKEELND